MAMDFRRHWIERGKGYFGEFYKRGPFALRYFRRQERILLDVIKGLDSNSVLEVGCGFGRITRLVLDEIPGVKKIKGIDISSEQIDACRGYVSNNERADFSVGLIQEMEEADGSYDLVMGIEVLMHIPFAEVEQVLTRMVRIARKHVVNLDWWGPSGKVVGDCFAHDYSSLYRNIGLEDIKTILIPRANIYSISFGMEDGLKIVRTHSELQQIWIATKH